jgi:hypothetical protein
MTRRELQELVGFELGSSKLVMVLGPDGTMYGRCEDGSWEPYEDETRVSPGDARVD